MGRLERGVSVVAESAFNGPKALHHVCVRDGAQCLQDLVVLPEELGTKTLDDRHGRVVLLRFCSVDTQVSLQNEQEQR